jgi:hypothetical protein
MSTSREASGLKLEAGRHEPLQTSPQETIHEQHGHLLVQLADLLIDCNCSSTIFRTRRYTGLRSVYAPSASHNCSVWRETFDRPKRVEPPGRFLRHLVPSACAGH